jgi:hypothetical protein
MGSKELRRIAKLEMLDEMEEWRLLASHYCIAWGWERDRDSENPAVDVFEDWSHMDGKVA